MLSSLLKELSSTTKPSEKKDILLKHDCSILREVIKYTYDATLMYHVKIKSKDVPPPGQCCFEAGWEDIKDTLLLCEASLSPKQNKEIVLSLLTSLDRGSQELFLGILNKNWQVGVSVKSILKIFPKIVDVFEVQLANKYKDYIKKKKYDKSKVWLETPKLDGVRCVAYRNGGWHFISRQGKKFCTVGHLVPELECLYQRFGKTWWDGELYKRGLAFEEIQGAVMAYTQEGLAKDIEFHPFVCGYMEDFKEQISSRVEVVTEEMLKGLSTIKYVPCIEVSALDIDEHLEKAFADGYEGIMLRDPDCLYDYKRSDSLLKLKESDTASSQEMFSDAYVYSLEYNDEFTIIEDGVLKKKRLVNVIWVLQEDGEVCKVGSGFSLDFRMACTEDPSIILDKVVEIKHQGYGRNGSMRFPRLYRVREDLDWSGPEPYEEV